MKMFDLWTQSADAEERMMSAPSAQPSEVATAVPDSPIQSRVPVSPQELQPVAAQSPVRSAAYQPSRFASEASQEADISNGDSAFTQGGLDNTRQGVSQQGPAATVARGLSDTPWLGGEAEQADDDLPPQQQFVSEQSLGADSVASSNGRQEEGFSRAGRLQEQPQSPGQGFLEQPQEGRSSFGSDSNPGLSGVKQVWQLFQLAIHAHLDGLFSFMHGCMLPFGRLSWVNTAAGLWYRRT